MMNKTFQAIRRQLCTFLRQDQKHRYRNRFLALSQVALCNMGISAETSSFDITLVKGAGNGSLLKSCSCHQPSGKTACSIYCLMRPEVGAVRS